ncbi:MAG: LamG-like jellyroll fold domain-containing protein [Patescibacteria group bacterium]
MFFVCDVSLVLAQTPVDVDYAFTGNTSQSAEDLAAQAGLSTRDPREVAALVINIILGFLGIIAVGLIIYAGFLWMTAAGNDDKIATAKKIMVRAAIGLLIILSAFGIAAFILRVLLGASGGGDNNINPNPNIPGGGLPAEFLLLDTNPRDKAINVVRNAQIIFYFNSPINKGTVANNFDVSVTGNITYENNNSMIVFTPDGACDTNLITTNICFPANTQISASVTGNLQRVSAGTLPVNLDCSASGVPCSITFTTGDSYDLNLPDGASCSTGNQTQCSDNNLLCASDFCAPVGQDCLCQNAPIIDYITPVGGFCEYDSTAITGLSPALYENKVCQNNSDCDFNYNGINVTGICNTITPNGAVGNMVTIGGRWFGDTPGEVHFSGALSPAILAGVQNSSCGASWSDNEVVVIVPNNAATGPVTITNVSSYSDSTDNDRGGKIEDFVVNEIERPGLCKIDPVEGEYRDKIILYGVNFGTTPGTDAPADADKFKYVLFGGINSLVQTNFSWSDLKIGTVIDGPQVPNLVPQSNIAVQVKSLNNVSGNSKAFKINKSRFAPRIDNVSPLDGAEGDYITIIGDNFGNDKGEIFFSDNDSAEVYDANGNLNSGNVAGSFNFPVECAQDNIWNEKQIIVKVPGGLSGAEFFIKIKAKDFELAEVWGDSVGEKEFTLGGEPKPGLCKTWPENGAAGSASKISFYGERFGDDEGDIKFYDDKVVDITVAEDWVNVDGTDIAKATVHADAETGEVKVLNSANTESNPLFFRVDSCLADNGSPKANYCSSNNLPPLCCPQNTIMAGSCVDTSDQCGIVLGATYSQYYVEFSTAASNDIPCDSDLLTPTCDADNNFCETQALSNSSNKVWCEPETCTCQTPGRPKVIVECNRREYECSRQDLPSPSPLTYDWDVNREKPLACTNAVITARFDQVMNLDTITDSTVGLYSCGDTSTSTCGTAITGSVSSKGYANNSGSYFEYTPGSILSADIWYKVQLNAENILASSTKLKLVGGEPNNLNDNADNYVWYFKTRASSEGCNIGCVTVVPTDFTARQLNQKINYKVMPDQEDNACIMINATGYDWGWESDKTGKATIAYNLSNPYYTSTSTATALQETAVNDPVIISAEETSQQKIGTSTLNIDFGFRVEKVWPVSECEDVCLNADVGAGFSAEINENSLSNKVVLQRCNKCSKNCDIGSNDFDINAFQCEDWEDASGISLDPAVIQATPREMSFNISSLSSYVFLFEPNTIYKAVLVGGDSGIKSEEGSVIDNPSSGNNYEWIFATGENICEVTDIEVKPSPGITTLVGYDVDYTSIPYSDEQLCLQDTKQRLKGEYYNWNWSPMNSENDLTAFMKEPLESNAVIDLTGTSRDYNAKDQETVARGQGNVENDPIYGMSQKTEVTAEIGSGSDGSTSIFDQADPVNGSADFILQCGWTEDSECHIGNTNMSETYGVGNDTCCYQRPWAQQSQPYNNAANVCRNALLEVTFNQPMDVSSFQGNVIIAAKFPTGAPCPDGREYIIVYNNSASGKLVQAIKATYNALSFFNNNILLNSIEWIADKAASLPIVKNILTVSSASAENFEEKWCAVNGNVSGYNQYTGGELKGVMAFAPTELLPTIEATNSNANGREHLILIKGDDNLEDADRSGSVKSIYGASMGKTDSSPVEGVICRGDAQGEDCAINGQKFYGQAIKFTTLADIRNSAGTPLNYYGICLGDHIRVEEPSWLFNTREDDARDNSSGLMYDTIYDADKEFTATMMSRDGQALVGIAGVYNWEWGWAPRDADIIIARDASPSSPSIGDGANPSRKIAAVNENARTRARTFFEATATIKDNSLVGDVSGLTNINDSVTGSADIRVFLCDNPWPPFIPGTGNWPYIDDNSNCLSGSGSCLDTHFELYYCRDKGQNGTSDDLPIISDNGAIRGYSGNIIKEFLFTRADRPNAPTGFKIKSEDELRWTEDGKMKYKIYYGTSSKNYTSTVNVGKTDYYDLNNLNLADGNTYYFAIKAIDSDGAESDFSNEVEHSIGAVINSPTALRANAFSGAKKIRLIWSKSMKNGAVDGEVDDYNVYLNYEGDAKNDEQKLASSLDCSQTSETMECDWQVQNANKSYYFQVEALRDGKASRNKTDYIRVDFGPVGYWKINEGSGRVIKDSSQFINHGNYESNANYSDMWSDKTLVFGAGRNDYVSVPAKSNLDLSASGGFTESVWINPDLAQMVVTSTYAIIGYQNGAGEQNRYPSLYIKYKDEIHAGFGTETEWCNFTSNADLISNDDYWYFITVAYDKKEYKLYINGELKGSFIPKNTNDVDCINEIPKSLNRFDIGKVDASYFLGNIADVKIYNHIRTAEQIRDDFNNNRARF